jgi:hypothetical protein
MKPPLEMYLITPHKYRHLRNVTRLSYPKKWPADWVPMYLLLGDNLCYVRKIDKNLNFKVCTLPLYTLNITRFSNIRASSMHPGWADTEGLQEAMSDFHAKNKDSLRSAAQGADTITFLASCPRALETGRFWFERKVYIFISNISEIILMSRFSIACSNSYVARRD